MIIKNFVVFEGIDGAGTSTQVKKLEEIFPKDKLFLTAEPSSTETGLFLRKMLKGDFSVDSRTQSFLFAADRCEHIYGKDGILEMSEKGKIVVSDRYFFSSLAYQGVKEGYEFSEFLNSKFPLPSLLFYFRINPEVSMQRVRKRQETIEIFEKIDYQKKVSALYDEVIEKYQKIGQQEGMKTVIIDAEKSITEIAEIIEKEIKAKIL